MQLTSTPPANIAGSGPVTRSATPPGSMGGGGASAPSSPSPPPSPPEQGTSAQNNSRDSQPSSKPEGVTEARNARNGNTDEPSPARDEGRARESGERASEGRQDGPDDSGRDSGDASPERQSEVNELRSRDREVRQHEQAHQVVGGQYAGAPTYDYERGPDGQLYATGGQVSIDTSPIPDDPRATINKMQVVRAAALAPAEPSPRDLQAAQEATSQMLAARAELQADQREEVTGGDDASDSASGSEPGEEDSDPRIALFRDVDGFSDAPDREQASTRFEAIA